MEEINEIYKTLLEQEISNHTIFITVLLGIVIILLGATWWWNKSGASKEIISEVEKKFQSEKELLTEELKKTLRASIDEKFKEYENKLLEIEANVMKTMAIIASSQKYYTHSIFWYAQFLELLIKLKWDRHVRKVSTWIIEEIEKLKNQEKKEGLEKGDSFVISKIYQCQKVLDIINNLPDILEEEKKKIKKEISNRIDKDDEQ